MAKTLYQKLQKVEKINDSITSRLSSIQLPIKFDAGKQAQELSQEEISKMLLKCFFQYPGNLVLAYAVKGEKPILESLREEFPLQKRVLGFFSRGRQKKELKELISGYSVRQAQYLDQKIAELF